MNECGSCHLDFGSVNAFDKHRVGVHEYTFKEGLDMEPSREDGRRCLGEDELEAAGFAQNAHGRWSWGRDLNRARAGLLGEPLTSDEACSGGDEG